MLKVGLLCGVIAAMSATGVQSVVTKEAPSKEIDTRFIIELDDSIEGLTPETAIRMQDRVAKQIKRNINASSEKVMSYTVLSNSLAVTGNKEDLEAISSIKGVKAVAIDKEKVVKNTGKGISINLRDASPVENESAKTMQKPEGTAEGEGTLIAILDNEFWLKGATEEDPEQHYHEVYTKLPTGVKQKINFEKVSTLGNKTNVGFHATQTNSTKGYEGSLYFNTKVPFYYDYAGDSENGNSHDLPMDPDVSSNIGLHGSHVSSIAGANADTYKGIAPNAQLALMKVFSDVKQTPIGDAMDSGNYSRFSEIGFLSALEDAVTLGADVINVSIGSDLDDFDMSSITMKVLEELTDAGVCSAISAGNGGKASYSFTGGYGNWTDDVVETGVLGSFANNQKTMSIASGQPDKLFYENAFLIGDENVAFEDQIVNREGQPKDYDEEFKMAEILDPMGTGASFDWVYVPGFGAATDYKGLSVDGKIAVVNRGSLDFATKYKNAADKGAIALVIINNDPTANDFNFRCSFGDNFRPTMPCCLVLFKDKPIFANGKTGNFTFITKKVADNKAKRTMSDFSSDGARFDLDLKPEITTPGTNIRGAVWPQNKEEKLTPYASYEYFNGTSMAAPNFAGAVSVLISKKAKEYIAVGGISATEEAQLVNFRKTVNMRMMSTATTMYDFAENDEDGTKSITSPRLQGAGMVNLGAAYNTNIYLKGSDNAGADALDKSKILLRNNDDIAKGNIKLSFTAVNEGTAAKSFTPKVVVMRPAFAKNNKVVSKDYNLTGEVSDLSLIPGLSYAALRSGKYTMLTNDSTAKVKDVISITKDLEYYTSVADANAETNMKKFEMGYYTWTENNMWEQLEDNRYTSIKDVVLTTVTLDPISIPKGETKFDLQEIKLTDAQKNEIAEYYPYGTYIEGFVQLDAVENDIPDLSIPYLGFYSLTDRDSSMSFDSAPVVEPFSFEKDKTRIYQSDLVNDLTKQLIGKSNVNFESMWLAGYAESTSKINTDKVLTNDENFGNIKGFKSVGTIPDPYTSEFTATPKDDIYVGNPRVTNTMIIQQFVLRSVKDNYFTIKNKESGEVVYKSALEDFLFGEQNNVHPLYKSHVDADYLGAGYVAHRAVAIIPLYNPVTHEAFASGEYEIEFNYQLASTSHWISKAYTMHIDAEAPVINSIIDFEQDGAQKVRITFKDTRVAYAVVGSTKFDVSFDEASGLYYVDLDKEVVDKAIKEAGKTSLSEKRLFVQAVDYARGKQGAIIHFDSDEDYSHFSMVQGYGLTINNDFTIEDDGSVRLIILNEYYDELPFSLEDGGLISTGVPAKGNGKKIAIICGSTGGGLAVIAVLLFVILKLKKAKKVA